MTSLALLTRYWREGLIGLLGVALMAVVFVDAGRLRACKRNTQDAVEALAETKSQYAAAQAIASAKNVMQVRAIERANAAKTAEITDDLERERADARARGSAYVQRLREQADTLGRATRATDTTGQADTARPVDGASGATVLDDDVRVCSDAVVKAEGWQKWYDGLQW